MPRPSFDLDGGCQVTPPLNARGRRSGPKAGLHIWLVAVLYWFLLAAPGLACPPSEPRPVVVSDDVVTSIGCSISILELPRGAPSLAAARAVFDSGGFRPLGQEDFARGLVPDAFWLTFEIQSAGETQKDIRVDLGRPYEHDIRIWSVSADGMPRLVLQEGTDRPFHDRSPANRMIASEALSLAPGGMMRIWVYAAFDGPATLPISIHPVAMTEEVSLRRDFPLLVFVSVSATLLIVITAFAVTLRSRAGLCYAGFFACVLAYNAQLSGLLFAHVWPSLPGWNAMASHPIGLAAIVFALLFAREFTRTGRERPVLLWTIRILIALSIGFMLAPLLLPLVRVKSLAGLIILAFLLVQLWAAVAAMIDKVPGRVFYLAGTLVLFAYLGTFTAASQIEAAFGPEATQAILPLGQLLDGAIFCLAVFRQTWALRLREMAFRSQAALAAAELASTRHDIHQPLLSLRAALDKLSAKGGSNVEVRRQLAASLSYIEGIIEDRDSSRTRGSAMPGEASPPRDDVPLQLLLDNLALMFSDDAFEGGTRIRVVSTSVVVKADALDLFRILSNLVSNAVQHSSSDLVLIGVRHVTGTVAIDILDRGVGLSADGREAEKTPSGDGLGLEIVKSLSRKNGWRFQVLEDSPAGTHLRVSGLKPSDAPVRA